MPLRDQQALLDANAQSRRKVVAWLVGINCAIAAMLVALAWLVLHKSHRTLELQATSRAESLAAIAQLNVRGEIERVDGVIRATASELERLLAEHRQSPDAVINDVLRGRFTLLEGIEAFRLTDAAGVVRWGTDLPDGPPVSVSDRDYFRQARASAERLTVIGGPLTSRVSNRWVVAFVHPLRLDGRFAGVLYASINAEHFQRNFQRYDLEPLDSVALRRDDRRLVARYSPGSAIQGQPGDTAVSPELLAATAKRPDAGHFVSRVQLDGEKRTTAYRSLQPWPFTVFVGISNDRFFEPWRRQVWLVVTLSGCVWALALGASFVIHRASRREADFARALLDQGKRLQALLRTAGDGIHITDATGHLVEMSDSFAQMLKSSREQLLGRHISSWDVNQDKAAIDAWLAKVKPGERQRVDVQHRCDDGQILDVEMQLSIAEIADRLFVFSSARDVTEQRRLMREQVAMLENDLVGMARVKDRVITWRNRAAERLLGYGPGELQDLHVRQLYWDDEEYRRVGVEGYKALREEGYYHAQLRMRKKSGELVWVDFGAVPLSATEIFVILVDITALKAANESLAHTAFHDPLTQLPNRVLLLDRTGQAQAVARRLGAQVAVCYLDLDGFKAINDRYGHEAGDQLLQVIAGRMRASIRPSDTAARMGGDEFVLVLAPIEGVEWKGIVDRVMRAIGEDVPLGNGTLVRVGVTVGVALTRDGEEATPHELIARADHLMLRAKRSGKNRWLAEEVPGGSGT
jgi:diguanylate cyclase (GGDEF)-like protein/PAS domain S-box-containing protein